MSEPTFQTVLEAAERIKGLVKRTPVETCQTLDLMSGNKLFFKCENFQKIGAFKFRGACNAVFKLEENVAQRGVVTHSSGNHAQALALAAQMRGIPAHIVMPSTSSVVKKRGVLGYGGNVIECIPTLEARETTAAEVVARTGGVFIAPFDHIDVISGQGTLALELIQDVGALDVIIAPVGGGGMLSGVALAAKGLLPNIMVIGAEPKGADDAYRSKKQNEFIPQTAPNTIADGLLTSMGSLTWPIIRDVVDEIVTVTDEEIISAMRLIWERMKLVVEPSGATSLAVALQDTFKQRFQGKRVGIVFSGGNVDLDKLPWVKNSAN
eukprot:GILJ01006324.1.p1 GENE.GILJ01006324.1~~GILJ01006324.1.p1  ORF type:complete len:323 (-),score=55.82 GILJ01006324.1:111-1079(-)